MENVFMKMGRMVYAIGMFVFGIAHFTAGEKFAVLVPILYPMFWVYFTGICLVISAIAIIIKRQIVEASLLLFIMLMIFVIMVHLPQTLSKDELTKANGLAHTLKTLSLGGVALFFYGYYKKVANTTTTY